MATVGNRMAARPLDKWDCFPVEIIGFIHQLAINVSLEMCQKLYNPEALEIIGVEIIISPKKLFDVWSSVTAAFYRA